MESMFGTVKWYLLVIIAKFVQRLAHLISYLIQIGKRHRIPPVTNPLLSMSATKIASQIREGKLLSEDVVECFIQRIREVNPFINAVAEERFEEALSEARAVDLFVQSKVKTSLEMASEKPLLGVPFSAKLLLGVKGLLCNGGSMVFKDVKANEDAQVIAQMKNAGAICLVTTNSPEFGINIESFNSVYGLTRNPHDTRRTPGGSSGGEAALISSAGSVLGIGSDLIGSLRFPAFCTGLFSHKPTNGIVSNLGMFPYPNDEFMWYVCVGPMCRYAEDLPLAMKILLDPRCSHIKVDFPVNFSAIKIYYIEDEGGNPTVPNVDREILQAQQKVVNHVKTRFGCMVRKVQIKSLKVALQTSISLVLTKLKRSLKDYFYGEESDISASRELLKSLVQRSRCSFNTALFMNREKFSFIVFDKEKSEKYSNKLRAEMDAILDSNSVLITPTFPKKAVYHYETFLLSFGAGFTAVCNILGLPVTQCPLGMGADGLPLGVQVIGNREHDFLTIAFAKEIEKAFGGWVIPVSRE